MHNKKPSTVAWTVTHLGYPLLPALLEAGIRFVTMGWNLTIDTMNAATLAISVGVIAVFVNQSIRSNEAILSDGEDADYRNGICTAFIIFGIFFFAFFAVLVLLQTLVVDKQMAQLKSLLRSFQIIVFVFCNFPIVCAVMAQRSFKLRASLV